MASIRRRRRAKQDVWLVDYRDPSGSRRRLTATTKAQAEDLLAEMIRERQIPGPPTSDRDITVAEYRQRWLTIIASEIKPRTLQGYAQLWRLHVKPAFGHLRVRELHRGMIKAFLAQKRAAGLSKNSVRLIRSTLSVMLSDAVDDGIILANPALHLGRGHRSRSDNVTQGDRQRTIKPMSRDQLSSFLASAGEHCHRYAPLFLLLAHTGLRPGEAFALQWEGVDFTALQIHVERALSAGRIETTKTGLARTVDLSELLARGAQEAPNRAQARSPEARLGGNASMGLQHGSGDVAR